MNIQNRFSPCLLFQHSKYGFEMANTTKLLNWPELSSHGGVTKALILIRVDISCTTNMCHYSLFFRPQQARHIRAQWDYSFSCTVHHKRHGFRRNIFVFDQSFQFFAGFCKGKKQYYCSQSSDKITKQWRVQDFPEGVALNVGRGTNLKSWLNCFPKNCMKTRAIGPRGDVPGAPPWTRQYNTDFRSYRNSVHGGEGGADHEPPDSPPPSQPGR